MTCMREEAKAAREVREGEASFEAQRRRLTVLKAEARDRCRLEFPILSAKAKTESL
jgi:hypothetical protein